MDAIRAHKLEQAVADLATRVMQLEASETALIEENRELWTGLEELHRRVTFMMQYFQFRKKVEKPILDGNGRAVQEEISTTMYDLYAEKRPSILAQEQEIADAAQAGTSLDAQGSGDAASASATAAQNGHRPLDGLTTEDGKIIH